MSERRYRRRDRYEPSPSISESDEQALAWAGVSFEDSKQAAKPEGFCRLQAPAMRSWCSLSHV